MSTETGTQTDPAASARVPAAGVGPGETSAVGAFATPAVDTRAFRCAVVLLAFLAFSAAFAALHRGETTAAAVALAVVAVAAVAAVAACAWSLRSGVRYDAAGLVVVRVRSRRIPWAAIDGFALEDEGGVRTCALRRRDGGSEPLPALGTAPTHDAARTDALQARVRALNAALHRSTRPR